MHAAKAIRTLGAASALALALQGATVFAAGDGPYAELAHERHENFEAMGDAFVVFRDQIRGDAPEDFAAQAVAADTIVGFSTEIPSWFPEGSGPDDGYKTDALHSIWEDWEKFESIANDFVPRAAALRESVDTGEMSAVLAQFREVGGTCKSCHDDFRAD